MSPAQIQSWPKLKSRPPDGSECVWSVEGALGSSVVEKTSLAGHPPAFPQMRGLTGCRQISLHTRHQAQACTLVRLRPLPLPPQRPLGVSSLLLGCKEVRLRFRGSVSQRRQKNNAPAPGDLVPACPGYYPATGSISARPKSVTRRSSRGGMSACACALASLSPSLRPASGSGWLARALGWYRNENPPAHLFVPPPLLEIPPTISQRDLPPGQRATEPGTTPHPCSVWRGRGPLLTSLQGDS